MCASYGLDPRFIDPERIIADDAATMGALRAWAAENAGDTLLPTGKHRRNLNPIITGRGGTGMELAWWGYLVGGEPARFPSINTRSERLRERAAAPQQLAIVPATSWFELRKPDRQWFAFARSDAALLGMAAVVRPGRTSDGQTHSCYSILMRPAPDELAAIHDRVPLLIHGELVADWLGPTNDPRTLLEEATVRSDDVLREVATTAVAARP